MTRKFRGALSVGRFALLFRTDKLTVHRAPPEVILTYGNSLYLAICFAGRAICIKIRLLRQIMCSKTTSGPSTPCVRLCARQVADSGFGLGLILT